MSGEFDTVVFLGPSLPTARARDILPARYEPPARRGDVYRWITGGVHRVVLIDGEFHLSPSVWHRELLAALDEGIEVWGASSMGALRAVELAPLGMRGVGRVFEWYADGRIDGDDEVALLHADASEQYRALSLPLVSVRHVVDRARADAALPVDLLDTAMLASQDMPFTERSWPAIAARLDRDRWGTDIDALLAFASSVPDIKALDAQAVLRACRDQPISPPTPRRGVRDVGGWMFAGVHGPRTTTAERALAGLVDADPDRVRQARRDAATQWYALEWARLRGVECPTEELDRRREAWLAGRIQPVDAAWLATRGLTRARFDQLLNERLTAQWLVEVEPAHFGELWIADVEALKRLQLDGAIQAAKADDEDHDHG